MSETAVSTAEFIFMFLSVALTNFLFKVTGKLHNSIRKNLWAAQPYNPMEFSGAALIMYGY